MSEHGRAPAAQRERRWRRRLRTQVAPVLALLVLLAGCASPGAVPIAPGGAGSGSAGAGAADPQAPAGKPKLVKGEDLGTTIQVNYSPQKLPQVFPTFTDEKTGPLLFSDNPEWVKGAGITLSSKVPASDFRYYLYHVNDDVATKYFHLVLINKGQQPATIKVGNHALAGPDKPYGPVGYQLHTQFYQGQAGYSFTLQPGAKAELDPKLAAAPVKLNLLLTGMWDVVTDQPLQLYEIASDSTDLPDPAAFKPTDLAELSGAGVCTCNTYHRTAQVELDGSKQFFYLASGEQGDAWVSGPDELHGVPGKNDGNYGVDYHVTVTFKSPVNRKVKLYMSTVHQLGGAIKVDGKMVRVPEDNFGEIAAPDQPGAPYDSTLIGKLDLKAGATSTYTFDFMPPGSFYLPAIVHVAPVE